MDALHNLQCQALLTKTGSNIMHFTYLVISTENNNLSYLESHIPLWLLMENRGEAHTYHYAVPNHATCHTIYLKTIVSLSSQHSTVYENPVHCMNKETDSETLKSLPS